MRQVVLDTETTGIELRDDHRIIEIGAVELTDRKLTGNNYHQYLQPDREIDAGAMEVHGITNEYLADKPRFGDVVDAFMTYVEGAELIIHNAPFDVGFINHELRKLGGKWGKIEDHCQVLDTLVMARQMHPGQRNTLDALCKRYDINNAHRELHGALLDSEILADVYLMMTGGQVSLLQESENNEGTTQDGGSEIRRLSARRGVLSVIQPNTQEQAAHEKYLSGLGDDSLWKQLGW